MKKLFNKKFILILASAMILLVVLVVGSFLLTNENKKSFSRDGYIISFRKEEVSEKFYFEEGTNYKTNINSQLVFTDTSGEKVNVDKDNFLHYSDGGIKFLKNGVIMGLENINATIVPYYNITNKTVLEYSNKSYYIEAIDKTLAFNNLIGRISDNKFIVAGVNIKLQLAGNDKLIEGDYFEITFIEGGIIKVENQDVSYQTTAQSSYILVDDTTRIDLGTKKIYYNDEEKMSMSQMTIDGNENIEIIPEKEDDGNIDDENSGENENNNDNPVVDNPIQPDNVGQEENNGEQSGEDGSSEDSEGDGSTEDKPSEEVPEEKPGDETDDENSNEGTVVIQKKSATIELIKADVSSVDITAKFSINDPTKSIEGDLVLSLINMDTGTVLELGEKSVIDKNKIEFEFEYNQLAPDSNYLLTITEVKEGSFGIQYFQKLFRTDVLGLKLVKDYVTSNSIKYIVDFGTEDVQSVQVQLIDPAKSAEENVVGEAKTITPSNNEIMYNSLESNTDYIIKVDTFVIDNCKYFHYYKNVEVKTLKKTPSVSGLIALSDKEAKTFTVGIKEVSDPNEAITGYRYEFYKVDSINSSSFDNLIPEKTIVKKDNMQFTFNPSEYGLNPEVGYKYKVVVEYNNNEMDVELEVPGYSDALVFADMAAIDRFEVDEEKTTFNKIAGTIVIKDTSCTIPVYGRMCYSKNPYYNNEFKLKYKAVDTSTWLNYNDEIKFVVDKENPDYLRGYIEVKSLKSGKYSFNLFGDVDNLDGRGIIKGVHIGRTFEAETKISEDSLIVQSWESKESTFSELINIDLIIGGVNDNDFVNETLANSMHSITFNLYANDVSSRLENNEEGIKPIATKTVTGNLRDLYYMRDFTISTSETFDIIGIQALKDLTKGVLQGSYTIEITDLKDEAKNIISLQNGIYVFEVPGVLFAEDQDKIPSINARVVTKEMFINEFPPLDDELTEKGEITESGEINRLERANSILRNKYGTSYTKLDVKTPVFIEVEIPEIDLEDMVNKINAYYKGIPVRKLVYYVCDADKNIECSIDESLIEPQEIDLTVEGYSTKFSDFWLDFGTKYSVSDTTLTRGHNYVVKAKFLIDTNNDGETDTVYPTVDIRDEVEVKKQEPTFRMSIIETTEEKVIYKYEFINDIDNAVYDNKMYYTVEQYVDVPEENPEEELPEDGEDGGEVEEVVPVVEKNTRTESQEMSVERSSNQFEISGLATDDIYKLSYKIATIKNNKAVKAVPAGEFIFDGKFTYDSNTIKFETLYNDNGNKLKIIFKSTNSNQMLVDRISAFHMILSANGLDDYEKLYPTNNTTTCDVDGVEYRCILVDYTDIEKFKGKDITINISVYYDTGIINNNIFSNNGFLENENGFILQKNNYYEKGLKRGSYIEFNSSSPKGKVSSSPSGIYNFGTSTKNMFYIKSLIDNSSFAFATGELTAFENKYTFLNDSIYLNYDEKKGSSNVSINNKYLDKVEVGSDDNMFKFNSIIPGVSVSNKNLVNGTEFTILSSGITSKVLENEFQAESGEKYYYYIDIYKDEELTELYRQEKIAIDLNNKKGSIAEFTGFMPNTTYYFTVSAYLKKNDGEYKKTLLFKEKNNKEYEEAKYNFATLNPSRITPEQSFDYTSYSTKNSYSERDLNLKFETNKKIGEYQIRVELYDNVNLTNEEPTFLLKETLTPVKTGNDKLYDYVLLTKNITDSKVNIDLVYGGSETYVVKAYLLTESCVGATMETLCDTKEVQELPIFGEEGKKISFPELEKPKISIDSTSYKSSLDFEYIIEDPDRVIKDGRYWYQLQYNGGRPMSGTEYENEVWNTINISSFDANGINNNKVVAYINKKFANLESEKGYNLHIEAPLEMNNFGEKVDIIYNDKATYTVNDYGISIGTVGAATNNSYSVTLKFTNSINLNQITSIYYSIKNQKTGDSVKNEYIEIGSKYKFEAVAGGYQLKITSSNPPISLDKDITYEIITQYFIGGDQVAETSSNFSIESN